MPGPREMLLLRLSEVFPMPDLATSLGYVAMYNGANVGATSPNVTETKTFNFTLTSPQSVSIGFLGNMVGSGDPGSYFEVRTMQLIQN